MGRQEMLALITRDRRRLVAVRAVWGAPGDPFPDPAALWRKPLLRVSNGPQQGQKLSLEDLIDRHRRLIMVDAGDGPAAVETVFGSLLFVTPEPLADPVTLDRFLSERIRQSFGPLIDPLDPVGVAVVSSLTASHALTVELGFGVHAPAATQAPRGAVRFRPAGDSIATPVTLPGGRDAGLYPGQRWLAFARSETDAPAQHPDVPAGMRFLLTAPGEVAGLGANEGDQPQLHALPSSSGAPTATIAVTAATPPDGVDCAFALSSTSIDRGETAVGQVEIVHDTRPSRWQAKQPQGLSLSLAGVAIPTRMQGARVERFWLDLTSAGALRASALMASTLSAVIKGARARLYDRRALHYRSGEAPFAVSTGKIDGEARTVVVAQDRPLGFVALPTAPTALSAEPEGAAGQSWALDWLDAGIILDVAGNGPTPLPEAWRGRPGPVLHQQGGRLMVGRAADLFLWQDGTAVPAQIGPLAPGVQLILGPLVVDLVQHTGREAA